MFHMTCQRRGSRGLRHPTNISLLRHHFLAFDSWRLMRHYYHAPHTARHTGAWSPGGRALLRSAAFMINAVLASLIYRRSADAPPKTR